MSTLAIVGTVCVCVLCVHVCVCVHACGILMLYTASRGWGEQADRVRNDLLTLWKKFLLNQFHDVIPGSCIEMVNISHYLHYKNVDFSIFIL